MKRTILIYGLFIVGFAVLGGCHNYNSRVDLGVDYYGTYGYPAYSSANYPYYYPYPYYPYPSYYYPYQPYYPYYPYFAFGFGFSNVIISDGFVRSGRQFRGTVPGRSGGRVFRR